MKFNTLIISGFGPFPGSVTVDFDTLGAAGLFLLSGPTGAGKTTILDAICYALYGETTGQGQSAALDGRSGAQLRCTRSSADEKTEVTLAFTVATKEYKVVRNPEYERAKRGKSGGTTKETAKASLHRRDSGDQPGDWEPIATGVRDVDRKVAAVTGFEADQFRRVIVIPQGRFREVLISTPDAREDLLKRIFRTGVFEVFEKTVAENAKQAGEALSKVQLERKVVIEGEKYDPLLPDMEVASIIDRDLAATARLAADLKAGLDSLDSQVTEAAKVLGAAAELKKLVDALTLAEAELAAARKSMPGIEIKRGELDQARSAVEPLRLLGAYLGLDAKKTVAESDVQAAIETEAMAADRVTRERTRLETAKSDHAAVSAIDLRLGEIATKVGDAKSAKDRHTAVLKGANEADKTRAAAESAAEQSSIAERDAKRECDRAESDLKTARAAYHAGSAARLATALREGEPCPVCGNHSHPSPAEPTAGSPTDGEVAALERACEKAQKSHAEAVKMARTAQEAFSGAKAASLAAIRHLAEAPAPPDVALLESEQKEIKDERTRLVEALGVAEVALKAAEAARVSQGEKLSAARSRAVGLAEQVAVAKEAFDQCISATTFGSIAALNAAGRTPGHVEQLATEVAAGDRRLTTAEQLVESRKCDVAGREAPDVTAIEEAHEQAVAERNRVKAEEEEARLRRDRLTTLKSAHADVAARLAAAESGASVATSLQHMVDGRAHGEAKVSLHRWVLSSVLEQVMAHATETLRQMTRGRYELARTTDAGDRRGAAGLDIDVIDTWNGTRRRVQTLSGGETFLASLSLSLALAKTAEDHQGGRRLETVFIDEGFGSLDSETLDYAMAALQKLRGEGRVVGVISHVDEMQRAIPAQLRLKRQGEVTTLSMVGVGASP